MSHHAGVREGGRGGRGEGGREGGREGGVGGEEGRGEGRRGGGGAGERAGEGGGIRMNYGGYGGESWRIRMNRGALFHQQSFTLLQHSADTGAPQFFSCLFGPLSPFHSGSGAWGRVHNSMRSEDVQQSVGCFKKYDRENG